MQQFDTKLDGYFKLGSDNNIIDPIDRLVEILKSKKAQKAATTVTGKQPKVPKVPRDRAEVRSTSTSGSSSKDRRRECEQKLPAVEDLGIGRTNSFRKLNPHYRPRSTKTKLPSPIPDLKPAACKVPKLATTVIAKGSKSKLGSRRRKDRMEASDIKPIVTEESQSCPSVESTRSTSGMSSGSGNSSSSNSSYSEDSVIELDDEMGMADANYYQQPADPILVDLTEDPSSMSDDDVIALDDITPSYKPTVPTSPEFQGVRGVEQHGKSISSEKLAEICKNQGNDCFRNKDYKTALNLYNQAISLNNKEATYYSNRSACHFNLGAYSEALADGYTAVQLDNSYVRGHERLLRAALTLGDVGRCDIIIAQATSVIQLGPEGENCITSLDLLKQMLNSKQNAGAKEQYREELFYTEKAMGIALGNNDLRMSKVELLFRLNRLEEAVQYYQLNKKDGNGSAEGFYILALCHYYSDNVESSLLSCQQSIRLEPDKTKCIKLYKKLKNLHEAREEGRKKFVLESTTKDSYDSFIHCIELLKELQALLTSKNILIESKVLCNLAKLCIKLKKWDEAIQHATEAITINPKHVKSYAVRAGVYKSKDMFEEAVRDYEAYLKAEPQNADIKRELQSAKVALAQSKKKDYYKILGVTRGATDDELKKAYKKLAMAHHPDRHSNATPAVQKQEEKKFQELGQAYAILSDPAKRRKYDMGGYDENTSGDPFSSAAGFGGGFDPTMFFSAFMNGQQHPGFSTGGFNPGRGGGSHQHYANGGFHPGQSGTRYYYQ